MNNLNKLTDSNEFSEFYYKKLKERLDLTDINLNRLGFVGFFIELLGNVQFDIKNYYNFLFNESFPISASDNLNLLYHSAVYGYTPILAKPSEIIGSLNIKPLESNEIDIFKRELYLNKISFSIDNIEFYLDADYKVVYQKSTGNYYSMTVQINYKDFFDIVPILYSNSSVKTIGFLQYSIQEYTIFIPNYQYGSNFLYDLNIKNYVYDVTAYVKDKDAQVTYLNEDDGFVLYKTAMTNIFIEPNEEVILYSMTSDNKLQLKFGSGVRGKFLPGAQVKLSIKTTKGERGNIGENLITRFNGNIIIKDFDINNDIINQITASPQSLISLNIGSAIGGKDPSINETLKKELLQYIQTRENLVSEIDFHNNLKEYTESSEILFKKTEIAENIIYLYGYIKNKYLNPIYTMTQNVLKSDFEYFLKETDDLVPKKYIVNPMFYIENRYFNCPFYFEFNKLLQTYDGYIFYEDITFYPSQIPLITDLIDYPKDVFINLLYDKETNISKITFNTKTDFFTSFEVNKIIITSQILNLLNAQMEYNEDNDNYELSYTGVIKNSSILYINIILDTNSPSGNYTFYNVQNVYDQIDNLRLRKFNTNENEYIINIPLIDTEEFCKDKIYYTNLIKDMFDTVNVKENRMISDEVQFRFLNTFLYDSKFEELLKQKYKTNLVLPLKVEINITFSREDVITYQLKVLEILNDIKLEISKFLLLNSTGLKLNLYKTKLIDICHNFNGVKTVEIKLTDYNNTVIDSNLESVDKEIFLNNIEKYLYLEYTPIFWWYDLNNIVVNGSLI